MEQINVGEEIKKLMRDNLISSVDEANTAIEFVAGLVELLFEQTMRDFPNATVSIREERRAYEIVRDLDEFIEGELK